MIGWMVGLIAVIAVIVCLGKRLKFVPGFGTGVSSPDGRYTAYFKCQRNYKHGSMSRTAYELSVVEEIHASEDSFVALDVFKITVPDFQAMPDLDTKKSDEIVQWNDQGMVTFYVSRQPIVVNPSELASNPKVQEKKALILAELAKRR
jgi:hypothetical protein